MAALSPLPGVYRYFDAAGAVLYVGKARNLKNGCPPATAQRGKPHRSMVQPHRAHGNHGGALRAEALLLENNLIKTLNPKVQHPVQGRQSYPYLKGGPPACDACPGRDQPATRTHGTTTGGGGQADRLFRYPSAWAVERNR